MVQEGTGLQTPANLDTASRATQLPTAAKKIESRMDVRDAIESTYSGLMDDMEASVKGGDSYFAKLGKKDGGYNKNVDTRTLIMISPIIFPFGEPNQFDPKDVAEKSLVAVTRSGFRIISPKRSAGMGGSTNLEQAIIDEIRERSNGKQAPENKKMEGAGDSYEEGWESAHRGVVNMTIKGEAVVIAATYPLHTYKSVSADIVKEAIAKSRREKEISRLGMTDYEKEIKDAETISEFIKSPQPET